MWRNGRPKLRVAHGRPGRLDASSNSALVLLTPQQEPHRQEPPFPKPAPSSCNRSVLRYFLRCPTQARVVESLLFCMNQSPHLEQVCCNLVCASEHFKDICRVNLPVSVPAGDFSESLLAMAAFLSWLPSYSTLLTEVCQGVPFVSVSLNALF